VWSVPLTHTHTHTFTWNKQTNEPNAVHCFQIMVQTSASLARAAARTAKHCQEQQQQQQQHQQEYKSQKGFQKETTPPRTPIIRCLTPRTQCQFRLVVSTRFTGPLFQFQNTRRTTQTRRQAGLADFAEPLSRQHTAATRVLAMRDRRGRRAPIPAGTPRVTTTNGTTTTLCWGR
jgi:uncharacterized protein YkwD